MKKFLFAVVLSLFAVVAMAQSRTTFIVNAGYQGANLHINEKGSDSKMKSGFRVGLAVDFALLDFGSGELSVQPGVYYSTKGAKESLEDVVGATMNLGYLELPILANVRFDIVDNVNVFVNAGPYLAYGLNSKTSVNDPEEKVHLSSSKNIFKEDDGLRPFDAGIQVGAGAEYRRIMLTVGGQFGLTNMLKKQTGEDSKLKMQNRVFFVTLGYRF